MTNEAGTDLQLMDLRRYAISNRIKIRFTDPGTGHECLMDENGITRIPGEDRSFRVEDALASARTFEVTGGEGKPQRLTREQMTSGIRESLKKRGSQGGHKEDDD